MGEAVMLLGHMIQGDWIADEGTSYQPVTVYFDVLRTWDSRAVWWKMENDAAALEANIRFAARRNAQVMFTFGEPPVSALLGGYAKRPTMDAWLAFIRRVVTEAAGRVTIYEGWNEPAMPPYWDDTPEQLVNYERERYLLIKELQPNAIVLSPSFTEPRLPRGRNFILRYLAAGGTAWCDGVAFHGYAASSNDLRADIAAMQSLVGNLNGQCQLWNTEYVIAPVSAEQRGAAMVDSLLMQEALGVRCAVWNAEIPGSEDYTDETMALVHHKLTTAPRATAEGCRWNPFRRKA